MQGLDSYRVHIKGTRKLLCHNSAQLANPISDTSKRLKEVSGLKKKTEQHYQQMSDIEWYGGLYLNEKLQPIIPTECLEAMIAEAARKHKLGKDVKSGLEVVESPLLQHDGPKNATAADLEKLPQFRDMRMVGLMGKKLMRTRPCFPKWELNFEIVCDPEIMKENDLKMILETGGRVVGLGDYRPKFGKFEVVSLRRL